jgi:hypothetical protein
MPAPATIAAERATWLPRPSFERLGMTRGGAGYSLMFTVSDDGQTW